MAGRSIRARLRASPAGRVTFRILVALLGLVLVLVGLLLVPLPGPGWLIVLGGVAVWAVEFEWARRLLRYARRQLHRWNSWMAGQSWLVRVPVAVAVFALVAVVVWLSMRHALGIDPLERFFGVDAGAVFGLVAGAALRRPRLGAPTRG
jgi:uncharacterized protein (TIGR02611 family)